MTDNNKKHPRISVIVPPAQLNQLDGLVQQLNEHRSPYSSRISRHGLLKKFIEEGIERLDGYCSAQGKTV
jgi:hypothetical protein